MNKNMLQVGLLLFLLFFYALNSRGQSTFTRYYDVANYYPSFGLANGDNNSSMIEKLSDGGYVFNYSIYYFGLDAAGPSFTEIIKTDSNFYPIWKRVFQGNLCSYGAKIFHFSDSSFLTWTQPSNWGFITTTRINAQGQIKWSKNVFSNTSGYNTVINGNAKVNGNIRLAGALLNGYWLYASSEIPFWVDIDSSGNIVSAIQINFSSSYSQTFSYINCIATDGQGNSYVAIKKRDYFGNNQTVIAKINSNNSVAWSYVMSINSPVSDLSTAVVLQNGDILFGGQANSQEALLMRMHPSGSIVWAKKTNRAGNVVWMKEMSNRNIIINVGTIVTIDSNGSVRWQKNYSNNRKGLGIVYERSNNNYFYSGMEIQNYTNISSLIFNTDSNGTANCNFTTDTLSFSNITPNFYSTSITCSSTYCYATNVNTDVPFIQTYIDSCMPRQFPINNFYTSTYDTTVCAGGILTAYFSAIGTFPSGNVLRIQLSDSNGNFNNPVVIGSRNYSGTLAYFSSDTIQCHMPAGLISGNGYRIRLLSSNPALTSLDNNINIRIYNSIPSLTIGSNSPICNGDSLKLMASSSNSIFSIRWDGPNNFVSFNPNPFKSYINFSDSGYYYASISACGLHDSVHVIIKQSPSFPNINYNSPLCTFDTLFLTAYSNIPNVAYSWNGPNGFLSGSQNPVILNCSISDSGMYYVTANLNGCIKNASANVNISVKPLQPMLSSNSPVCIYDTLKLNASDSTANVVFLWNGPNGFNNSGSQIALNSLVLSDSGIYSVTAFLTTCHSNSGSIHVVVNPAPQTPGCSSNGPICEGDSLQLFANDSTVGASIVWSGPNAFYSNLNNPVIYNTSPNYVGLFKARAVLNGCYSMWDSTTAVIKDKPGVPVLISNGPICESDTLQLNSSDSSSNISYQWTGPNNFNDSVQNIDIPNVQHADSGMYILSVYKNGCKAEDSINVVVKQRPAIISLGNNGPICAGDTLYLTSTDTTSGIQYDWTGPNNFNDSTQNPDIANAQFADSGKYILTVSKDGCSAKDSVNISIKPLPFIAFAGNNTPICARDSLKLWVGNNTSGVNYEWTGPNNFTDTSLNIVINNAQHPDSGNYYVRAEMNGCYSAYDTMNAIVNDWVMPSVTITSFPLVIVPGVVTNFYANGYNGGPNPSYQWYKNSVAIPGAGYSSYTCILNAGDWISAILYGSAPCAYVASVISNDIFCGGSSGVTSPGLSKGEVTVWPNPARERLNVSMSLTLSLSQEEGNARVFPAALRIFDFMGKLVINEDLKSDNTVISIGALPDGVYSVQVYGADGILLKAAKMIKE